MRRLLLPFFLAGIVFAQVKVANPGFEAGELGGVPTGWSVPTAGGFAVKLVDRGCHGGTRCAMMTGVANLPNNIFGNLMQTLPAGGYTLRHIRLRAAIRVEGEQTRAQMWLRLDRADNSMAFLENMNSSPVTASQWKTYQIETNVAEDVSRIVLGVILFGSGTAWLDDVSLDILDEVHKDTIEASRPLTSRGLVNLTAFAKLYGYIRHFHPSDQAARTDWETFAVNGVRYVESADSTGELVKRLQELFQPIAPTMQVFPSNLRPSPPNAVSAPQVIRYVHQGVGLPSAAATSNIYKSDRQRKPALGQDILKPFEAELVPGITASVPLVLYTDSTGTLPHAPLPDSSILYDRSAEDRGTRLAAVVIAWNVFQHFYPYVDVVKTHWSAELPKALRTAATDTGVEDFQKTLQRLVAALKDGHGRVGSPHAAPSLRPPLTLDWVQGQFIVTRVQKGKSEGVSPGDRILKIDGKPIEQAAAEVRGLISGATEQWIRYRSAGDLSVCNANTKSMKLEIEPFANPGTSKSVELQCGLPTFKDMETYTEPRPDTVTDLEPGILYVDLDRISEADWNAVVPRLEKAKGIIFDMRGYPGQPGIQSLAHLTDNPVRSAKWNVA